MRERVGHPIAPFYDAGSRILILGSFPSQKSREQGFYYGHPRNRFWQVTAAVLGCAVPETIAEKQAFLRQNGVALWDVIASCDIEGSADASIQNVVPNDVAALLSRAPIQMIFLNGKTAEKYYNRYLKETVGKEAVTLPSTSPANAAWDVSRLCKAWRVIRET